MFTCHPVCLQERRAQNNWTVIHSCFSKREELDSAQYGGACLRRAVTCTIVAVVDRLIDVLDTGTWCEIVCEV